MTLQEFLSQIPGNASFSRKSLILLFAYYLRKYTGATEFGASDLRQCFSSAQRRVPTDLGILLHRLSRGKGSLLLRIRPEVFALSAQAASEVEAILPGTTTGTAQLTSFLTAALPHLKKVIDKVTDSQEKGIPGRSYFMYRCTSAACCGNHDLGCSSLPFAPTRSRPRASCIQHCPEKKE